MAWLGGSGLMSIMMRLSKNKFILIFGVFEKIHTTPSPGGLHMVSLLW